MCALLVFTLLPGGEEAIETVGHLLHDGHLPHSEVHEQIAAFEDCEDTDEHGCTALSHHCDCCASLAALPPMGTHHDPLLVHRPRDPWRALHDRGPPDAGVKPFLRPPIA